MRFTRAYESQLRAARRGEAKRAVRRASAEGNTEAIRQYLGELLNMYGIDHHG